MRLNYIDNFKRPFVQLFEVIAAALAWISTQIYIGLGWLGYTGTAAAALAGNITSALVSSVLMVGLSALSTALSKPGSGKEYSSNGSLINTRGSNEAVHVVYGSIRVGGNIVYVDSAGYENRWLNVVISWSEGPISGIATDGDGDMIWLDEKRISFYQAFSNIFDLEDHWNYTGTATQASDPNMADPTYGNTAYADPMIYTAYTAFRLKHSQDAWMGFPSFTAKINGRLLYDPRDGTIAYSTNPALVWLDFVTNRRYGFGLDASLIDMTSVGTAATWCETNSITFNGVVIVQKETINNVQDILNSFRGYMIWSNGKYYLKTFDYDTAVMNLTEDDIDTLPDRFMINVPGIPETPNTIRVHFADPNDNYIVKMVNVHHSSSVSFDGLVRENEIPLIGTADYEQAVKLGTYYVKRARYNKSYSFACHPRTAILDPGDMVQVTHTFPGWTNQILRVDSKDVTEDGKVSIKFIEENSDIYDLSGVNVSAHSTYQTNLPDFAAQPDIITNLIATTGQHQANLFSVSAYIEISWDFADMGYDFEVYYKKTDPTVISWQTHRVFAPFGEITVPVFTGTGTTSMSVSGDYTGAGDLSYVVEIDAVGAQDTFKWSDDGGIGWDATGVNCTTDYQTLNNGVRVRFTAITGAVLADSWAFDAKVRTTIITRIINLPIAQEYYYKVRSINNENIKSDWIPGPSSITTWSPGTPDMSGYSPVVTPTFWLRGLNVDWSSWAGISTYPNITKWEVYASTEAVCTITADNLKRSVGKNTHATTILGLTPGLTYDVRILPYDSSGAGTASD